MKRAGVIIAVALLGWGGGCASKPSNQPQAQVAPEASDAVVASALLFDPPVILDEPPIDLSRESRERSAFVGYEDQTVTFSYIHIDDRQLSSGGHNRDRYERRAVIDRFGTSYR